METEESKIPSESASEPTAATAGLVTVTATQDCNLYANGQSVELTAGDTVEMTPQEALQYANLGLVEGGGNLRKGSALGGEVDDRAIPKRK